MAVQKGRKTPSKRGMRRSHDSLKMSTLSIDPSTGETHQRHHITADGFYRPSQKRRKKRKANARANNFL